MKTASAGPGTPYYGSVDFSGTITLKTSNDEISGVRVRLLEDSVTKRTDYTDANGEYEFTWTVERFKIYNIVADEPGYNDYTQGVIATSSEHVVDFEMDGRVALFMWASDIANQSVMSELGNQLINDEGFTDVLYYENKTDWEDAIDDVDDIETSNSLVFIYLIGHGAATQNAQNDYTSKVAHCGKSAYENYNICITSDDLADKLQDLESHDIFLMVEACLAAGFYTEYKYQEHIDDNVFVMTSSFITSSVRWYGDNATNWDPQNPDETAWGGAFTNFFFEALDNGDNDGQAFTYAYNNANDYAGYALSPQPPIYQVPKDYDNVYITWF